MNSEPAPPLPSRCAGCTTELAPALLRCPGCGALVFADLLRGLAGEARQAEERGDTAGALERWQKTLLLLPADASQFGVVRARIEELDGKLKKASPRPPSGSFRGKGILGGLGAALLLALSKIKMLLLGLTKASTLLSMVAFFGVYLGIFGWQFALGVVLLIYVHEMGHVVALQRYGIPASAPMFIPGFGALVRLHSYPPTPAQDARVGLAGPLWGAGAAAGCGAVFLATRAPIWAALAQVGGWINLFNLTPVWQLDGARGIRPLARTERVMLLLLTLLAFALTGEHLLLLVAALLGWQVFRAAPEEGDRNAFLIFATLILALGAMTAIRAQVGS